MEVIDNELNWYLEVGRFEWLLRSVNACRSVPLKCRRAEIASNKGGKIVREIQNENSKIVRRAGASTGLILESYFGK